MALFTNCQGKWALSDNAASNKWLDSSGNNNHLIGVSSITAGTGRNADANGAAFCQSGSYLELSQTSYSNAFHPVNAFTLSAFINPSTKHNITQHIAGIISGISNLHGLRLKGDATQFPELVLVDSSSSVETILTSPTTIEINTYTHIVGVYDNNYLALYINASLVRSISYTAGVKSGSTAFRIGKASFSTGYPFFGAIDDTAYWNRGLSSSEVTSLNALLNDFSNPPYVLSVGWLESPVILRQNTPSITVNLPTNYDYVSGGEQTINYQRTLSSQQFSIQEKANYSALLTGALIQIPLRYYNHGLLTERD